MTKAPHRPAVAPDEGGALPRRQPRASSGQFASWDAKPDATDDAPKAQKAVAAAPVPKKRVVRRAATPAQLVARVTRAIDRELSQIEEIVGGGRMSAAKRTEAEKRARTMASFARTLAEVTRLRAAADEARPDHDDDAVPRDLDEFRRTLETRLARIAEAEALAGDRGDDVQ